MTLIQAAASALWLLSAVDGQAREARIATSEGECLHVVDVGQGEPVVLVPGQFGSAFSFRKLYAPLVASGCRVVVVEPLGVGDSCRPRKADYTLTAQADRLDATLGSLGVDEAVLVAHSVGASIAFRMAYRHPQRVKAIVSLEGGPAEAASTPGFRRAMRFSFLIKLFGGVRRIRGKVRKMLREHSADPRWVTDEIVEGYMGAAARDLDATLGAFKQMAKAREPERLAPRLREVRCPVRLLLGGATRMGGISAPEIDLLERQLASFEIETVPNAGHFLFEEKPRAVVAAVERTLALVSRPSLVELAGSRGRR